MSDSVDYVPFETTTTAVNAGLGEHARARAAVRRPR